ncbi:MAG: molybdopterin molybdotransferase MoeA [Chitinispirillaceae bacterium]|nr:molybdopterin molybdotransferase MoeA [Chitinispirillaceae bacterium]
MKPSSTISFDRALAMALAHVPLMPAERIPLDKALGRVLGADVASDVDLPPSDVSAMDGYACRGRDRDSPLRVIETIPAGRTPRKPVCPGQCSRIMTGAPLPKGADTVVMFEDTVFDKKTGSVIVTVKQENRNIRLRAEDIRKGDTILRKGTKIDAPHIAVLAGAGETTVRVFRRPVVGVIATGDELVEPQHKPRPGQIRNSNGWQLCAQAQAIGCKTRYYGIVHDNPKELGRIITKAQAGCDVILLSGGVSMGDFDFVPMVLKNHGYKLLFEKVAVKPGKPTVFGIAGKKRLFGMPGNPVSAFVIFEMMVKPFLYAMMRRTDPRPVISCALAAAIKRKNADRLEFRPVRLMPDGSVRQPGYHGSAHIHAYTQAHGLVMLEQGITELKAGDPASVLLLKW